MTTIDHDEDAVVCAGCDEPGSIDIVTFAPPTPLIGRILRISGATHVAAWHGACWVDADPDADRVIQLPVPFTGSWKDLDRRAPDGLEGRRRMWGATRDVALPVVAAALLLGEALRGWLG